MTIITLTLPGRPLTQNETRRLSGRHWSAVKKAKDAVEAKVYAAVAEQHGHHSNLRGHTLRFPVRIAIQDHCRTANLRDTEACAPTIKVALDVLTDIGVWPDDGPAWVGSITYLPPRKTGVDELVISIHDDTDLVDAHIETPPTITETAA